MRGMSREFRYLKGYSSDQSGASGLGTHRMIFFTWIIGDFSKRLRNRRYVEYDEVTGEREREIKYAQWTENGN